MINFDAYKWKNRLLLVFAPAEDSPDYQRQMQMLEGQKAEFEDRDLLIVELLAVCRSRIDTQPIDAAVAQTCSRFNVDPQEFSVLLVGKDGTSKHCYVSPVSPIDILAEIDAMPMRQQEMQLPSS